MTIAILIYVAVSLVLGGAAATIEIWSRPADLPCADGRGTFKAPPYSALWMGLFVMVLWPILLIVMIL